MAISEAFAGSEAVGATTWSMPRDASYSPASLQTADGVYQLFLDLSDMVGGDILYVEIKEAVDGSSAFNIYETILSGPQSPAIWVSPSLIITRDWDMTLDALAGTITVTWSIRKVA